MSERFTVSCPACDYSVAPGPHWWGCPSCKDAAGHPHWLEVRYDSLPSGLPPTGSRLWDLRDWLPVDPSARAFTLGEGNTPLIKVEALNAELGLPNLHLKLEFVNPTGSFKDRAQSVGMTVARQLGLDRAVIVTTGNAGVASSAYATLAGVSLVVITTDQAPVEHLRMMRLFGATTVVVPPGTDVRPLADELVRDHAFYPASVQGTYEGAASPYQVEGYKTIALEVASALDRPPDRVCVPTSSGDALYGIHKGFRELREAGLANNQPRMTVCQAQGADAAVRATREDLASMPVVEPDTIASSVGDPTGSQSILDAIRTSGGDAWSATDAEIVDAIALLGRSGICVEAASATTIATLRSQAAQGALDTDEVVVAVLTGTGMRWPSHLEAATAADPGPVAAEVAAIMDRVQRRA